MTQNRSNRLSLLIALTLTVNGLLSLWLASQALKPQGSWLIWLLGLLVLEALKGRATPILGIAWSLGFLGRLEHEPWDVVLALSGIFAAESLWRLGQKSESSLRSSLLLRVQWRWLSLWAGWGAYALLHHRDVISSQGNWEAWLALLAPLVVTEFGLPPAAGVATNRTWMTVDLLALTVGLGFLAVPHDPLQGRLLLFPVLLGYALAHQNLAEVQESQELRFEKSDLDTRLSQALRSRAEVIESWKQLDQEKQGLEFLTQRLSLACSWAEVGGVLGDLLGPRLGLSSLAFYCSNSGHPEDLEVAFVASPGSVSLQNFRLLTWGQSLLQVAQSRVPASLQHTLQPPIPEEPAPLLLPLGSGVLYLGRPSGRPWASSELHWLGWFLDRCGHIVQGLGIRSLQSAQLQEAKHQQQSLSNTISGQQFLIEAAQRFSHHLDPSALWNDLVEFLGSLFPLQACCLVQPGGRILLASGQAFSDDLLAQVLSGLPVDFGYLAAPDRDKWPLSQEARAAFDNLLLVSVPGFGTLLFTFWGSLLLQRNELELIKGVAQLLATSLSRASLHQDVVQTYRKLEASQALWLQTHKTLALAQMSAGLAHELNSPLGAIRLALEAAAVAKADTQKSKIDKALAACAAAQQIIERLGQLAVQEQTTTASCDLVQVLRQILEQLQPQMRRLGIEVGLEGPASLVVPLARETIEGLVVPLVVNAIEALEGGKKDGRVRVRLLASNREGQGPKLEVWDNGPGIDPAVISRITEPFFTTKKIGKNRGLGLASVSQLAQRNQVELSFQSQTATVFSLSFPAGADRPMT